MSHAVLVEEEFVTSEGSAEDTCGVMGRERSEHPCFVILWLRVMGNEMKKNVAMDRTHEYIMIDENKHITLGRTLYQEMAFS